MLTILQTRTISAQQSNLFQKEPLKFSPFYRLA